MPKTFTTQQAAGELGRSYDHVRKLLAKTGQPVDVIGRNNFWSKAQIEKVRTMLANSPEVNPES